MSNDEPKYFAGYTRVPDEQIAAEEAGTISFAGVGDLGTVSIMRDHVATLPDGTTVNLPAGTTLQEGTGAFDPANARDIPPELEEPPPRADPALQALGQAMWQLRQARKYLDHNVTLGSSQKLWAVFVAWEAFAKDGITTDEVPPC